MFVCFLLLCMLTFLSLSTGFWLLCFCGTLNGFQVFNSIQYVTFSVSLLFKIVLHKMNEYLETIRAFCPLSFPNYAQKG